MKFFRVFITCMVLFRDTCLGTTYTKSNQPGQVSVPSDIPSNVIKVELKSNGITDIKTTDFQGLNNLQQLYLDRNVISSIEAGAFSDNPLVLLSLAYNPIAKIPDFPSLYPTLHDLYQTKCSITNAATNEIKYPNLKKTHLNENYFDAFPIFSAATKSSIQEIHLGVCRLPDIPTDYFVGFTNLQRLFIHANYFTSFTEDTFRGLTNIKLLYLNANRQLITIGPNPLKHMPNLQAVMMKYSNGLTTFPCLTESPVENVLITESLIEMIPESCSNLGNLKRLDVPNNQISAVEYSQMKSMVNLQYADLHHNKIECILKGTFDENTKLVDLFIGYNSLKSFYVDSCDSLKSEFSTRRPINLPVLQKLHLPKNELTAVPILSGLPSLKDLKLLNNKISEIEPNTFDNNPNLEYANFMENYLISLSDFGPCTKLKTLDLSKNRLSTISASTFEGCTALKDLNLAYNYIQVMPYLNAIGAALETLDLNSNRIIGKIQANHFKNLAGLMTVHFSQNFIEEFDIVALTHTPKFRQLNFANNQLKALRNANKLCTGEACNLLHFDLTNNPVWCQSLCWAKRIGNITVSVNSCSGNWSTLTLQDLYCPDVTTMEVKNRTGELIFMEESTPILLTDTKLVGIKNSPIHCVLWCSLNHACTKIEHTPDSNVTQEGICEIKII